MSKDFQIRNLRRLRRWALGAGLWVFRRGAPQVSLRSVVGCPCFAFGYAGLWGPRFAFGYAGLWGVAGEGLAAAFFLLASRILNFLATRVSNGSDLASRLEPTLAARGQVIAAQPSTLCYAVSRGRFPPGQLIVKRLRESRSQGFPDAGGEVCK